MGRLDYVNWQEASDDLNAARDAAANRVMDMIERGEQPTESDLRAADLCVVCAGFGFTGYEDDGLTEVPCRNCKSK